MKDQVLNFTRCRKKQCSQETYKKREDDYFTDNKVELFQKLSQIMTNEKTELFGRKCREQGSYTGMSKGPDMLYKSAMHAQYKGKEDLNLGPVCFSLIPSKIH